MQKTLLAIALALLFSFTQTTPAQALTYSPGSITEDTIWTKAEGPYLVDTLYIPAGITLTIEPGTIVKLNQPGCNCYENIWVAGRIVAGALNSIDRVVFTSVNDDIGGDTNNDGTTTIPTSGDWRQIYITQGGTLELYDTDVRYGGSAYAPHIYFNGDNIRQINNVGGTVIMDGADLAYGYIANYRQWFNEGSTTIRNSSIHDSGNGLTFTGGNATVEGNTFARTGSAIEYPWSMPLVHHDNHGTGFITRSGLFESDATLTPDTLPYTLGWLNIPQGVTLTILPGSILKGLASLYVYGTLVVGTATATDPVVITSYADDTVLGDTNGDGAATTPQPGDWGTVTVTGNGRAHIAHTTFRYGGAYTCDYWGKVCTIPMLQNAGGTLTLSHTIATDAKEHILLSSDGTTTVTTSEFARGTYGVSVQRGTTTIHSSRIHDNSTYGVFNAPANPTMVDATNNWWGSPTGPTHPSNPGGTGDRVSGNVDFTPWPTQEPTTRPTCTVDCNSNVLFLPGLQASRLYEPHPCDEYGCTTQLWEPAGDVLVRKLFLTQEGESINENIHTSNVIDEAFGFGPNIYETFIDTMNSLRSEGTIADWAAAPYDWRFSPKEILQRGVPVPNGISYVTPNSAQYILDELSRLAASSRTGKVTIVAHSYGGLIAKEMLQLLGDDEAMRLVDRLILVASPQTGTPQAFGGLLHGFDQGIPKGKPFLLQESTARELGEHMPSAYALLPSARYFADVGTPLAKFANSSPILAAAYGRYGGLLNTSAELHDFLLGSEGRIEPEEEDTLTPNVLHETLLMKAEEAHARLDAWMLPQGIEVIQIAGWGMDTLATLTYSQKKRGDTFSWRFKPELVEDGDGTVVVPSALALRASAENVTNWWVNLQAYDNLTRIGRGHADILEIEGIQHLITNTIMNISTELPGYISLTTPLSNNQSKKIRYFLHSPLSLDLYDDAGNHTGISTTTGVIEHGIPGAYYREFGEVKYITVDPSLASTTLHLVLDGQASGFFDLEIEEVVGNVVVATTTFADIPTATSTRVTMSFTDGTIVNAGALTVDEDGNGIADFSLEPKLNETVTFPPLSIYHFSGFLQPVNDTTHHPEQQLSVFRGGSTIPVKFQLKNATGTPIQAKTLPVWLTPERGTAMNTSVDEPVITTTATNGDSYRWDSTGEQYIYNWSTKGFLRGYWYRIFVKLDDGKTHSVTVGLR